MPANPFSNIEIFQTQPPLDRVQKINNRRLPVQGFKSELNRSVRPLDNGLMLDLAIPHHPYILPPVECTAVGLPHPVGKLPQGELHFLHAKCGFAYRSAQVQPMVAVIGCIMFVIGHLSTWDQVGNPGNICCPQ